MSRVAYTLIETLAVLVVLGLVAALGVPALVRTTGGDPLARAIASTAAVDQRLRQAAIGRGGELRFAESHIEAWVTGDPTPREVIAPGFTISGRQLPRGELLRTLLIDCDGRSDDAELVFIGGDRRQRITVHGLSGEWKVEEAP